FIGDRRQKNDEVIHQQRENGPCCHDSKNLACFPDAVGATLRQVSYACWSAPRLDIGMCNGGACSVSALTRPPCSRFARPCHVGCRTLPISEVCGLSDPLVGLRF